MIAIHIAKSIACTAMSTKGTRKMLLGIEMPLDTAMYLARNDKLGEARRMHLTPKQSREFERWWEKRNMR
jgi:hypothetical protein